MGTLYVNNLFPTTGSTVQLNGDVTVVGTTPTLTIGDAGAEDATLSFAGNAQRFHVALDDTADDLVIGVGAVAGTTTAIAINELAQVQVVDAFAANTAGTFGTFANSDATPSVATGNLWKTEASTQTINDFDDGIAGQTICVISTAAITYDFNAANLKCGSADLVTASGDVTWWTYDATNWYLVQFMDATADMSTVGDISGVTAGVGLSGGGTSGAVTLALDLSELSAVTPTATDSFATLDSDGAAEQRTTITALGTFQAGSNGGLISTTGVLSVSGSAIAAAGLNTGADEIVFLDADGSIKKSTVQAALGEINADDGGLTASGGQLIISGSNIAAAAVAVATDEVLILDSDGSIKRESIADLASGMAGTGLDASSGQLTVDLSEVIASDGANELLTSDGDGTATGESNLTYDGSTFVINDDARINDDLPLFFGTSNEAFIKYDEAGQDMLIISGSTFGTTLSGSLVRVVDKLSIGADIDSSKGSGVLVVHPAIADTTNGLIATFKSADTDYCRVNIDNTTTNGDTQLTFMSAGSSKWSVGNMGSNETFHVKSGFADFTDTDALVLNAAAGLSLNTIVTASSALLIPDDKKLYFGDVHESHIEYDEDLSDYLIISGSHLGLALSGSNVGISGDTVVAAATVGTVLVSGLGVSIDSTAASANFSVATAGGGQDLTIGLTGATDSSIVISSTGTGADAINIDTTAGSIDIDSADNITVDAADEISISTTSADGHITLASAHTAGVAFYLSGNAHPGSIVDIDAGILDIDVTAAATIDAVGIALGAGSGELDLTTTGVMDINSAALDIDTSGAVTIDAAGAASHIAIATAHTAGVAFHLDANANAGSIVDIDAGILDIDVTGAATISAGGLIKTEGAGFEVENSATAGTSGLLVDNKDTDQIAVEVVALNIDANVINVTADALTSGDAVAISSNSSDTTARAVLKLTNDHASATGVSMIELDQDSTGDLITANYGANGSAVGLKVKEVAGNVATDATVTDFASFFPANCVPIAIAFRVTTAITNNGYISSVGYELGGGADPDFFTTLPDGALEQADDTAVIPFNPTATSIYFASAMNLRLTHNAQPGAGAVRIALYYYQITAPTS